MWGSHCQEVASECNKGWVGIYRIKRKKSILGKEERDERLFCDKKHKNVKEQWKVMR